jgi:ADP-L-glycero-D-manno-heptose 6-epimerase
MLTTRANYICREVQPAGAAARRCYYQPMHVIVTGGAGFIGSNLVRQLADEQPGLRVTVVDDFSSGDFRNLRGFAGDVIALPCEELDWPGRFAGSAVDCIYHLASITDTTVADQRQMVHRNVESFRRILAFAGPAGVKVVYASSGATYGQTEGVMREDQPPAPANVYGFSKCILDNLAAAANAAGAVEVAGVRYFNVYGPGEAHKGKMASMVYQLYRQLTQGERPRVFAKGQHKRDFVYVRDAVAGTLLAARPGVSGVFNIGSGTATSFNEVIALLNKALKLKLEPEYIANPYEEFYQHHTEADLTKASTALGYAPQWTPAKGIGDYVRWLEQQ